jgi:hypothetical protein
LSRQSTILSLLYCSSSGEHTRSPDPTPNTVLKPGERGLLRLATRHETAKVIQGREVEVAGSGAGAGAVVVAEEVNCPSVAVVHEIEQNPRHVGSIGGLSVDRPLCHTGCRRSRLSMGLGHLPWPGVHRGDQQCGCERLMGPNCSPCLSSIMKTSPWWSWSRRMSWKADCGGRRSAECCCKIIMGYIQGYA